MKKELIAANLAPTDGQSTELWQVYEQYSAELNKVNDARTTILKEYSQEYDTLTDDQAHDLIRRWLETDIEQARLCQQFKAANFLAKQHDDGCAAYIGTSPGPRTTNDAAFANFLLLKEQM